MATISDSVFPIASYMQQYMVKTPEIITLGIHVNSVILWGITNPLRYEMGCIIVAMKIGLGFEDYVHFQE